MHSECFREVDRSPPRRHPSQLHPERRVLLHSIHGRPREDEPPPYQAGDGKVSTQEQQPLNRKGQKSSFCISCPLVKKNKLKESLYSFDILVFAFCLFVYSYTSSPT